MATMTLRVGGKQRLSTQSNARKQVSSIQLSENFLVEANNFTDCNFLNQVQKLNTVLSVEEQIQILKEMARSLSQQPNISEFYIKLLSEFYLLAEPKNPLKRAITRIFLTLPAEVHETIASTLLQRLIELMNSALKSCSSYSMNTVVNSISCCFDSFSIGVQAMSNGVLKVLAFLNECLTFYVSKLRQILSPANKLEVCLCAHEASRTTVLVLQKCVSDIKTVLCENEYLLATINATKILHSKFLKDSVPQILPVNTVSSELSNELFSVISGGREVKGNEQLIVILCSVLQLTIELMMHEDVPMDTKGNCGLIAVMIHSLLEKDAGWMKLLVENYDLNYASSNRKRCAGDTLEITELCLCTGFLKYLTPEELVCKYPDSDKIVIMVLFEQLLAIACRNTTESSIILGVNTALYLLSRNLCPCYKKLGSVNDAENPENSASGPHSDNLATSSVEGPHHFFVYFIEEGLQFIWTHLEHYMDSVRHLAHNIFQNCVKLAVLEAQTGSGDSKLLDLITEAVIHLPVLKKSRYIGLSILAKELSTKFLLERNPTLVGDLLKVLKESSMSYVSSTFECLMLKHQSECSLTEWRETWLCPILSEVQHSSIDLCATLEGVVAKAMKQFPDMIQGLLPEGEEILPREQLRILLACWRTGRLEGAYDDTNLYSDASGKWKGLVNYTFLDAALCHQDHEIRLLALSLIVECHKCTEALAKAELELVRTFLVYNINTQLTSVRQQALTLMKKLLTRLKKSSQAVNRNIQQCKRNLNTEVLGPLKATLKVYNTFLLWLIDFCFSNLFPGANFGRRGTALQLLTFCQEIIEFDMKEPIWQCLFPTMWSTGNASILLECLKDTYENNKALALGLLVKFPAESLELCDDSHITALLQVCLKLASSKRPTNCITAAYLLKTVLSFPVATKPLAELSNIAKEAIDPQKDFSVIYMAVDLFKRQLEQELSVAKCDLLTAASNGPTYGTLFCIRYLLQEVDFQQVSTSIHWQNLVSELVSLCFELSKAVLPVVNSSSPEGHLPMDFEPGSQYMDMDGIGETSVLNVTAQMLLLCSWRTVKEVSLFLGEIAERAPIRESGDSSKGGLVTEDHLIVIGDHFIDLLAETKHRGAFEQAYVGFCKLCSRLWKYPSGKLHQLPSTWLQDLMDTIAGGGSVKLCSTRRSAGVPFMVQALVTTELQVGNNPNLFQQSITTLLSLAAADETHCNSTETHTHCFNILRALFRHALLSQYVTAYVSKGVQVAIRGFGGKSWAERNSATLLFSSLITRIFGVQRSRDELNIRNRMTGRIFFHRYPELFDFLLKELKFAVATLSEKGTFEIHPCLFPILLILGRLYPSSLEGTDSNLQLSAYIPYVYECSRSSVLKTRVLAAKAMVPLITPNFYVTHLNRVFSEISRDRGISENQRHGVLLQIFYLLEEIPEECRCDGHLDKMVENWVKNSKWLLLSPYSQRTSFITSQIYLRCLEHLVLKCFSSVKPDTWQDVIHSLTYALLHTSAVSFGVGKCVYEETAAELLLELNILIPQLYSETDYYSYVEATLVTLLSHSSYEVVRAVLNFLLCILASENDLDEIIDLELPKNLFCCLSRWNSAAKELYRNKIMESFKIAQVLIHQVMSDNTYLECKEKTYLVLHYMPGASLKVQWNAQNKTEEDFNVLQYLLNQCLEQHENIGYAVLHYIGAYIQFITNNMLEGHVNLCEASRLCQMLLEFSSAERSLLSRLTVAKVLLSNSSLLVGNPCFVSVLDVCSLWTAVMILLEDDAFEVRETISKLLHEIPDAISKTANRWEEDDSVVLNCSKYRWPVTAQKAREELLDMFVTILKEQDLTACVVTLIAWSLRDLEGDHYNCSEELVFDKGEMNIYAEDITVTELACNYLNILVHESESCLFKERISIILTEDLAENTKQWLLEQCYSSISEEELKNLTKLKSIMDFVKAAETKVALSDSMFDCVKDKVSHFLIPGQKCMFVAAYKVRKLLEVLT